MVFATANAKFLKLTICHKCSHIPNLNSIVQSLKSKVSNPKSSVQSPKSQVSSLKSTVLSPKKKYLCALKKNSNQMSPTLVILYLYLVPLLVMLAAKRWPVIEKISPMVILYVIGLIVGNVGIVGKEHSYVFENISNAAVLTSIPLMLCGCDFRKWSATAVLKAFLTGLVSIFGYFMFRSQAVASGVSPEDFAKVTAAMTGIYTGGIPNFAPVAKAVELPNNLFLLVSGYDLVVTGIYLILIVFLGGKIVRWFFPKTEATPTPEATVNETTPDPSPEESPKTLKQKILNRAVAILGAIVIVSLAVGLTYLIPMKNATALIIIVITTLSILLSFWKPVRKLEGTFDTGLYFVYVFCLAVATQVNVHELEFSKYIYILYYIAFVVFGSLALQILLARLFKISGGMVLTSSISLINSPPFVPMVAAVLHDKSVILPGIAIGLLGYAVGNYLGIGIFMLLS